ncbi:diacylglycerol kinase [Congregibacter litoralis]|uniref:diacylglycerol kinase n=1 Tax=Congregibacter litoralis TaxID=393662 RepID=UPI001EE6717D|nr:diacylglycerol kinase [Congregibacter litoralis]
MHESAFRQELFLGIVLLPVAFYLSTSSNHLLLMIISLLLLLLTELLNSAIEAVADAVTLEDNPLIGRAKDMGSAAVFVALSLLALVYGEAVFRRFFA